MGIMKQNCSEGEWSSTKAKIQRVLWIIFLQISKLQLDQLGATRPDFEDFSEEKQTKTCPRLSYSYVFQHIVPVKNFHLIRKLFQCVTSKYSQTWIHHRIWIHGFQIPWSNAGHITTTPRFFHLMPPQRIPGNNLLCIYMPWFLPVSILCLESWQYRYLKCF